MAENCGRCGSISHDREEGESSSFLCIASSAPQDGALAKAAPPGQSTVSSVSQTALLTPKRFSSLGIAILAAGFSRRMGQPKLLLPLGEKPLLAHALDRMNDLPWGRRLVVIGEPRHALADLSLSRGYRVVYNESREEGQASSVRLAVSTLCSSPAVSQATAESQMPVVSSSPMISPLPAPDSQATELSGYLFLPGDQPFIEPLLIAAMANAFFQKNDRRAIVVPRHAGQWRSPVLFGVAWRSALSTLTGDQGGRDLIQKNPGCLVSVDWADEGPFADVDTWTDYEALQRQKRTFSARPVRQG
ncbi:conserved hypothetical protein [Heliomicrobium modesticaldum Ice1]|uniref:MobA-like NTP transferase domain-containing protein n=1 Tax=Heliobacterium modesticaldum (strain ATCC 51547 / Ice1) TaxID=498761 RepID=B0TBK3_HELMI|nr:nucleotidyltransferase family protein [Heliomicrobium modesticaldum]ABZ85216.1 conserved hypothetical protein [Heliomicrobium modesticaldum Ice1]